MKSQLFTNFKYNPQNNYSTNELIIDEMYNTNTDNGFIQTELFIKDLLTDLFNESTLEQIKNNNQEILSLIKRVIPYEYFNERTQLLQYRYFILTQQNKLFELNPINNIFEEKHSFLTSPNIYINQDCLYFFETKETVVVENENILSIEATPNIQYYTNDNNFIYFSVQDKSNVIYISEKCKLHQLSSNLNQYQSIQTNIEDGLICQIVNIKNKIYIVTQYSILKLNQENFTLEKLFQNEFQIYNGSIFYNDDYIVFFTSVGMYNFDGNNIYKIIDNYLNFDKSAKFIYFNNNLYILSYEYDNFIFQYKPEYNAFIKLKLNNIQNFFIIKNSKSYKLCFVFNNNIIKYISLNSQVSLTESIDQYVKFKTCFLGSNKLKQINNITIKSTGEFKIELSSDITSQTFFISQPLIKINTSLSGMYYDFKISSENRFKIDSILITYKDLEE